MPSACRMSATACGIGKCNRCLPRFIIAGLGPNVACVPNVASWHNAEVASSAGLTGFTTNADIDAQRQTTLPRSGPGLKGAAGTPVRRLLTINHAGIDFRSISTC